MDTAYVKDPKGCTWILLLAVDSLSKWIEAAFIGKATSAEASLFFQRHILSRFGEPGTVVTDGGPEFKGAFHELLEARNIKHRKITPTHRRRMVWRKRNVHTLKRMLYRLMNDDTDIHWALEIELECLRFTTHSTSKTRPVDLVVHEAISRRIFVEPLLQQSRTNIEAVAKKRRVNMSASNP